LGLPAQDSPLYSVNLYSYGADRCCRVNSLSAFLAKGNYAVLRISIWQLTPHHGTPPQNKMGNTAPGPPPDKMENTAPEPTHSIYVLRCENGKFYVGKCLTSRLEVRLKEHQDGTGSGSAWTRLHKPIDCMLIEPMRDPLDEDNMVIRQMRDRGVENVRGGSYSTMILTEETRRYITRQLDHARDDCIRCGRADHWVKDCYARTHADGTRLPPRTTDHPTSSAPASSHPQTKARASDGEGDSNAEHPPRRKHTTDTCHRCGRDGHRTEACYANTHANGSHLTERVPPGNSTQPRRQLNAPAPDVCRRCGRMGHWAETCYAKSDIHGALLTEHVPPDNSTQPRRQPNTPGPDVCRRCGRFGHWAATCYAKSDAHGAPI
jgi:predicted GIY-YIG superfamily endonuclease